MIRLTVLHLCLNCNVWFWKPFKSETVLYIVLDQVFQVQLSSKISECIKVNNHINNLSINSLENDSSHYKVSTNEILIANVCKPICAGDSLLPFTTWWQENIAIWIATEYHQIGAWQGWLRRLFDVTKVWTKVCPAMPRVAHYIILSCVAKWDTSIHPRVWKQGQALLAMEGGRVK